MFFNLTDRVRDGLKPFYLLAYRLSAFTVITCSLIFLLGWVWVMGFFLINHTWVAPTVLSPTSDKMLQFSAGYQQAEQNLLTLEVTHNQAVREYSIAKANYQNLIDLGKDTVSYGDGLKRIKPIKDRQFDRQGALADKLDGVKENFARDLKDGLITKTESITGITEAERFQSEFLNDGISWRTTNLTASAAQVQLANQILQAKSDLETKRDIVESSEVGVHTARTALNNLQNSAYYQAYQDHGSNLAFVAYDNIKVAKVGAPVYDCYLMIIACHKVGTIRRVYNDELVVDFPLFNVRLSRTVRGVMMDMDVIDSRYMGSTVMFVGKPLFF